MRTGVADPRGNDQFGRTIANLTSRQRECLSLAARHLTSKEIALRLGVSSHTVDQCFRRSMRALQARDRREALRLLRDAHAGAAGGAINEAGSPFIGRRRRLRRLGGRET